MTRIISGTVAVVVVVFGCAGEMADSEPTGGRAVMAEESGGQGGASAQEGEIAVQEESAGAGGEIAGFGGLPRCLEPVTGPGCHAGARCRFAPCYCEDGMGFVGICGAR
jgi:hypothetical protein